MAIRAGQTGCQLLFASLVSTLRGLLNDLGLKRRSKTMPSLGEYLASRGGNGGGNEKSGPHSEEREAEQASAP